MKKILLFSLIIVTAFAAKSQTTDSIQLPVTPPVPRQSTKDKLDLSTRANDHFMVQYGFDSWGSVPDSINTSGLSRHFNVYFMLDKPFLNSPKFSIGIGVGIGSSNMFFSDTYINLKSNTSTLPFTNVSKTDHFDKFKLTTTFVEIPLELRFVTNPAQPDKGFKIAVGVKGGLLISAHTKGKNYIDSSNNAVFDPKYINKEYEKKFINSSRFALTGRVGLGHISIDGSYQVTSFLKTGVGPVIHPYTVGLTLSGL